MPQQFPSDWTAVAPDADGIYSKRCASCGERFASRRGDARFCSASCRSRASRGDARFSDSALMVIASRCESCGDAFLTQGRGRRPRFCSPRCRVTHHRLMRHDAAMSDDPPVRHYAPVTHEALRRVRSCESPGCVKTFVMTHPAQRFCVTHRASPPVTHDASVTHGAPTPTVTHPASLTVNHDASVGSRRGALGDASARCVHCGESLVRHSSGRPKRFCSVRCRVAHHRAINARRASLTHDDAGDAVEAIVTHVSFGQVNRSVES